MPDVTRQHPEEDRRGIYARLIDSFNPAITLLVLVWVVGLTARRILLERGQLEGIADRGLTSLAFVVPLMLLGWAVDRYFGLGVFPREED